MKVREGDSVTHMPAIQAVLRSQIAQAGKGNGPAGRNLLQAVQALQGLEKADERDPAIEAKPLSNLGSLAGR